MSTYIGKIEDLQERNPQLAEKLRENGRVKEGRWIYRLAESGNVYRQRTLMEAFLG